MLEASFDAGRTRAASVTGAVQYDSGQRIRLHGLPTPDELAQMDEFLSGDSVTVQVQFAYRGDSQTEPRTATYDEDGDCWVSEVPNTYLRRASEVEVYVYVGYGSDAEHTRSKTMYTASFRPNARPAPQDSVTPDQINAWDALVAEVNLALSGAASATSNANAAAQAAKQSAENAQSTAAAAAQTAQSAAQNANSAAQTAQAAANNIGTAATDAQNAAKAANEAAQRLNGMNPVRSVNGVTPDENGAVPVRVAGAKEGEAAVFDATGNLVTSGKSFFAFTRATMVLGDDGTLTITTLA